jgi:pimeloyl-ACP methyl ester carboxylesterase
LARFLGETGLHGIVGAGHSLGAVTTLFCAAANPGLFRALVLIDPVIIPVYLAPIVAVAKWLQLTSRVRLPSEARGRRVNWPNREVLFRAYRATPVFARWQEPFLRDYVASGTVEDPAGGVRLRYPREWEARIFETVPEDVWLAIPPLRHVPLLVLRGEHSATYRRGTMRLMHWLLPQGRFLEIAGADHFVPMCQPEETVAAIKAFLSREMGGTQ